MRKNTLKVNKIMPNIPCSHKISILDNSSKKPELKETLLISNSTLTSFLIIPLTFLYDEFIDRPKLSEQKNPFEYIAPPATSGVKQKFRRTPLSKSKQGCQFNCFKLKL